MFRWTALIWDKDIDSDNVDIIIIYENYNSPKWQVASV